MALCCVANKSGVATCFIGDSGCTASPDKTEERPRPQGSAWVPPRVFAPHAVSARIHPLFRGDTKPLPNEGLLAAIGKSIDRQKEEDEAVKAKAQELMRADLATRSHISFNSETGIYLVITYNPSPPEDETIYHVHRLNVERLVNPPGGMSPVHIMEWAEKHTSPRSESYYSMLNAILAAKIGRAVTIMSRSAGEAEVIEGDFIPQTDLRHRAFWSAALEPKDGGSFAVRLTRKTFDESRYKKTADEMNRAAARLRADGGDILSKALAPHVSRSVLEAIGQTAHRVGMSLRIDIEPRERMPAYRGLALNGGHVLIGSGIGDLTFTVTLHEFIHQLREFRSDFFQAGLLHMKDASKSGGSFLEEGLTEFVKRLCLAKDLPAVSDCARFSKYYSADLLYVLYRLEIITVEVIVWTLISGDSSVLAETLDAMLGRGAEKIFEHSVNYSSDGNEEEMWFSSALAELRRRGISGDRIGEALNAGIAADMVSPQIFQAANGVVTGECPDVEKLF